jgi:hypothetical protein
MRYLFLIFLLVGCMEQPMTEQEKQTLSWYKNQVKMGREKVFSDRQKQEFKALQIKELQQPDSTAK